MNTPNKLTLLRVMLIPAFIITMLCIPDKWGGPIISVIVYAFASITDAIDGHLARKNNQVTDFGKFLDPLADKMLVITALILLQHQGLIHPVITVIIIARELMVTSIRLVAASGGKVIAAGKLGKIKTVTQMISTILLIVEPYLLGKWEYGWNVPLLGGSAPETTALFGTVFLYVATVLTVVSGVEYLVKNWKYVDFKK
ncbi:MAG: CDP-diacylglycerol--glycerol-3-phosphate 3-phosphatidyltransferase [Clostridia bacterium]|nr:CDP-diacylglycerol--glycerol-3-phosphate 3-phosphatidyltransferase [Clostridia bacterium]